MRQPLRRGSIEVEYEVTGSAYSVDVTYENSGGSTSREYGVGVPWSYRFSADPGDYVYISAQNTGTYGTVTVAIYIDGEIYEAETSERAYCTATASGML
ncbi:MAG: MmpS family transport accessory protein [Candidatus Fermentibacterota bacterium]